MRLIKQSFLYFKEGNSDKVYEIDLCDVGNDKYVVNFRYGRRGAQLKEGSKTPVPVSLAEAEKIYDALETEKLNKGYTTSESGVSAKTAFTLEAANVFINDSWVALPHSRNTAILKRLRNSVNGTAERFAWKTSRVIWKAGQYKIEAAVPYIIKLFNNGNQLHQYCCVWALARCSQTNTDGVAALKNIFTAHPVAAISKLAGAALVKNLQGVEKEIQVAHFINRLPQDVKNAIETSELATVNNILQLRIAQQQPNYNWLEDVYIIATEKNWLRPPLKKLLQQVPLKPNYFKHVRAIFKLSELLDDYEVTGLLACRFEREEEMFRHNITLNSGQGSSEIYIPQIEEWINLQKEFKKITSRLAYSQRTRWYFHGRVRQRMQLLGKTDNTDYVKLATALLIGYKHHTDFKEHFSTYNYNYNRSTRNYDRIETRFLQNAQAVYLHQVLSGNNPQITLQGNHLWRMKNDDESQTVNPSTNIASTSSEGIGGIFKKITGLFGKKKEMLAAPLPAEVSVSTPNKNGTPYLHLWNQVPQAYVQLLMDAEMEEIHQFAEENLTTHTDYTTIKQRLDKQACKQLLLSAFAVPAAFGYTLTAEKYATVIPDDDVVTALLNSIHTPAREKGQQWTEQYSTTLFEQSNFITSLIFANHADIRSWAKNLLKNAALSANIKNAVVGKSIAALLNYGEQNPANQLIITDAGNTLFDLFADEVKQVNIAVTADLLAHENAAVLLVGLRLLKAQKSQLDLNSLSKQFLFGLLQHTEALVREEGLSLLATMPDEALLQHAGEIISSCLSQYQNVRQGLPPVVQRMAAKENAFGVTAAETLMPVLLRKETTEGIHDDVSKLLCNELSNYLQGANKETALNLLYSNYNAAQNVGVVILEKYIAPHQLTLPQVIALGAHENLNVREWCWKFYKEQTPRIKYEKETAIKLLESKWQDSRQFAMQYFREQFTQADWNPETLITLADSVKPDVEAFGRELITKFFSNENGVQYLLKLSQHPSEKMQLFATNYLERFAVDDSEKITSLDFYFRAVLTRVNKSRIAKNRIYNFLLQEGRKSEAAAKAVCSILTDVSATAAIGDKAKCIDILLQLKALYDVAVPVIVKETFMRTA